MRIVSGKFKGRRFNPPRNLPIRPTTDFAKEGLFNVLRSRFEIEGAEILDLFAGSGNISLEFISRGAESALAVDQERNCIAYIQKIATELEAANLQSMRQAVEKYLKKESRRFDLIFADPPYKYKQADQLIELIFERKLLKESSYLILEHGKDQNFEDHERFKFSKKFGNVNFTFFA